MKVFINTMIYDYEKFIKNGYIKFDKEIVEVGDMKNYKENPEDEVVDLSDHLVLPGFINSHMHIYSTFARGMIVPYNPKSFKDILLQLWWKLDSKLDEEAVYYSGLVSAVELIKNGVTTVIDHHASGMVIKGSLNILKKAVVDEGKMRGIFCFETSDRFDVDEAIEENVEFMKERSEKHAGMFGLHASLSLSDDTLRRVSESFEDGPIHIHVAESYEDEQDSMEKSGLRVVERLEKFGLLTKNSILSHCVHINENEASILKNKEVYIAVNVTSNMNNAVGLPKTKLFKEYGIPIVIGNDGLGYNITRDWMNLYFSQKLLYENPIYFSINDLYEGIKNGYKLASELLEIKLGKIEKGYKADFTVVKYVPPTPIDESNISGHVFFGIFDKPDIKHVLVDGEYLMKNGQIHLKEKEIYNEASKVAKKVWERLR